MRRNITVNLRELVLSLSDAMDLASPALTQHQQRTAFVVWEMGKAARFSTDRLERIFKAALLHDIGAFSLEEKIAIRNYEVKNVDDHCIRGEHLLINMPWLKDAAKIIRFHHKKWQSWEDSIQSHLVLESQFLFLADSLEREIARDVFILHQHENIISKIKSLSGTFFHPQVVDLFLSVSHHEGFWLDLVSQRLYSHLLNDGPFAKIEMDLSDISMLSELFRNIIDFRSRFTSTHSSGVAASASMLARIFGLTNTEVMLMEVAGNLHDMGKLAIPNSILDKPGKLTKEEMSVMKSHTYYSYFVLSSIGEFKQIAEWAAYHHEKLDGSGYPFQCTSAELNTGARILMVADIFTALVEDRPYRNGMTKKEIDQIIKQLSDSSLLDARIVKLLFENYGEIYSYVIEKKSIAREFYEKQFAFIH
ncbi:MAG: HD domain-containing protein [Nitrospirae bacterium]|nr:HD domain-containing protein [Nitrospirota bacterium]